MKKRRAASWWVYVLECRGGRLYTGVSTDVAARYAKHCSGKGAAFTRSHPPLRLLAQKKCRGRSAALKLEYRIKQLSRADKLRWIAAQVSSLSVGAELGTSSSATSSSFSKRSL